MKAWAEDAIEQIATAELLNAANTSTGERLALIICDNAVEFMMIAYTEMEKQLVHKKIMPKQWENTKHQFHELLNFTVAQEPTLGTCQTEIQSFHNTRNDLYHTGKPLSVKAKHVGKYLKIAKDVLALLFSEKLTPDDWSQKIASLGQAILGQVGKAIKAPAKIAVVSGFIQVETVAQLTAQEIICVVLDAFVTRIGRYPETPDLEQSLALSHAAHLSGVNLSKRIYDCRRKKLIQKDALYLTPKGQKLVHQKLVLSAV